MSWLRRGSIRRAAPSPVAGSETRVRHFLFSFQTKLVVAITGVIILAILLAGGVFVVRTRNDKRQQALDHLAAASPAIYQEAIGYARNPAEQDQRSFVEVLDAIAADQNVRVLFVSTAGVVLHDTEGDKLTGQTLTVPNTSHTDLQRGFIDWEPTGEFPEHDVTLVTAAGRVTAFGGRDVPFRIVLAEKTTTIAGSWLALLPSLGLAALIAIPIASLAALALARQVAQPVLKLTDASEAMARGDFSKRVELHRDDEIGRLARSFTTMTEHVGRRDQQMRALLANVSHDLKTPMTSITGYAHALTDGTADPADVQHIGGVIADEAQHVNTVLADLLYLGEIDAGEIITRHEDVPLESIVGRCVRRIEPIAQDKAIELAVDLSPEAVLRDVDPDKLERAITNVLENAAKFTPSGGEITVVGRYENGVAPPRVVCEISNTGTTIAEDDLPRIFDRFFRGDRARRTANGSGLGLAITRQLVELNHGSIAAANTDDGVKFTLTLPA